MQPPWYGTRKHRSGIAKWWIDGRQIMTASAATSDQTQTSTVDPRLGSFVIGSRLNDEAASRVGMVLLEGVGADETPFAGRLVTIRCLPPRAIDSSAAERTKSEFARLRDLRHSALAPILEAGVAGGTTFIAEARPSGTNLADYLASNGKTEPPQVRKLVADLSAALSAMHAVGLTHGWISPSTVWMMADGTVTLSGFVGSSCGSLSGQGTVVSGQSALEDQLLLAQTAFAALTGTPFRLHPRVPDNVPGTPNAIIAVLSRATAARTVDRYPSVATFGQAFEDAMVHAGEDLVAGLWEMLGRGDTGMGEIMVGMAERFAPDHPDIGILRMRLSGGANVSPEQLLNRLLHGGDDQSLASASLPASGKTPEEQAAIAALLTPPTLVSMPKQSNPWLGFIVGTFFCVFLLLAAMVATLMYR